MSKNTSDNRRSGTMTETLSAIGKTKTNLDEALRHLKLEYAKAIATKDAEAITKVLKRAEKKLDLFCREIHALPEK